MLVHCFVCVLSELSHGARVRSGCGCRRSAGRLYLQVAAWRGMFSIIILAVVAAARSATPAACLLHSVSRLRLNAAVVRFHPGTGARSLVSQSPPCTHSYHNHQQTVRIHAPPAIYKQLHVLVHFAICKHDTLTIRITYCGLKNHYYISYNFNPTLVVSDCKNLV